MKKKFYQVIIVFCLTLLGFLPQISSVLAGTATPVFPGRFEKGVANTTIYINYDSGAGTWENYVKNAANNWMYTGWANPIYITFVNSSYGSSIDIYSQSDSYWTNQGAFGVLAETKFYRYGVQFSPSSNSQNWTFTEIHINNDNFRDPSFTNDQALGTVIHEMGHAFGLAHNNSNPYSIMCQTIKNRAVQRVQQIDNDAVVEKYK